MIPRKGAYAALVAACTLLAFPLACGAGGESPMSLLHDAMTAPEHVSYEGEVQTLRIGDQKSEDTIYRVEHRAPDLTRRWYQAPQKLYGDSVVSRGDTTYSVDVKRNRVVVSRDENSDDDVAQDDNFNLLKSNYRAQQEPDRSLDGRRVLVISLVNKYTGQTTMRVQLDSQTKILLEKKEFAADGSVVAETRIEQIRYTNAIPTAVFDVSKSLTSVSGPNRDASSKDYARVVKNAGFDVRNPAYLPDGFFAVADDVVVIKDVRTLHVLYSDGIRTVSLFENAKDSAVDLSRYKVEPAHIGGHDGSSCTDGPTTLLVWSASNLHFALVGVLNSTELERIASSVK
jgi:outer membrane lipoprotein-sorting protein